MHQLKLTFTGNVLDLRVEIEGKEIGLYFDGVNTWNRTLKEFDIEGGLDVMMLCKGLNGTAWNFEISVDNLQPKTYSGKIKHGSSQISDTIEVNKKESS